MFDQPDARENEHGQLYEVSDGGQHGTSLEVLVKPIDDVL